MGRLLPALSLALVLWGCGPLAGPPERSADRDFENLVVVMIDTLRSDHLPAYGYHRPTAPFLSELAAEGIQLQGYAVSSWTRSSIATLLTGLYPQRHRAINRSDRLPGAVPYLPEILAGHGFETVAFVTNGNVSSQFGFERGFSTFEERLDMGKPEAAQLIAEVLERAAGLNEPYCLYLHFIDPHDPYVPRKPWERPAAGMESYVQPRDILSGARQLDAEAISWMIDQYDAEISEMDAALRRLFAGLKEAGALGRTLVAVTGDHGEEFGEHGSVAHGQGLHEEVIRVPFILWAESGLPAYRSEAAFHQVDFVPTVLAALGVPAPGDLDGRSWWPEIRGGTYPGRDEQLFHLELDHYRSLALHAPPFKLIRRVQEPAELVYDLEASPDERVAVEPPAGEAARLRRRMSALDRRLKKKSYPPETAEATGEVRRQLQALGYLDAGDEPPAAAASAALALELDPAEVVDRVLDLRGPSRQLLQGWVFRDRNGTWSAPRARFVLPLTPRSRRIVLSGHSVAGRETVRCRVDVGGRPVRELELAPGPFETSIAVPEELRASPAAYVDLTVRPPLSVPGIPQPVGLHWNRFEVVDEPP